MKNLYNIDEWTDVNYLRIGEILLEAGKINLYHLSMALDIQKFNKLQLGELFLAMKVITKEDLNQALFIQEMIQKRCNNA